MKTIVYSVALSCLLVCSSCSQTYADRFEHQKMIIDSYTAEHASTHGAGFVVSMAQKEAINIKAPNSMEFKKMLEEQLAVERQLGHNYCPFGYEIRRMINFLHSPTVISVDCKVEGAEKLPLAR